MSAKWNDKIVDAVWSVISSQNYCFVLPLVFFGVSIATMFTDLEIHYNVLDLEENVPSLSISHTYFSPNNSPELIVSNKVVFSPSRENRASGWRLWKVTQVENLWQFYKNIEKMISLHHNRSRSMVLNLLLVRVSARSVIVAICTSCN